MQYGFDMYPMQAGEHSFWVAESLSLKGCVGQGDDMVAAIQELEENEKAWLEAAAEAGIPIPSVSSHPEQEYSGKLSLRISPLTHRDAARKAKQFGISLNQYLNDAVVSYNAR